MNISVGTIFSIIRRADGDGVKEKDFLRPGTEQVCSGYIIYGSSTMLVYTTGHGVHGFTLDPSVGEFLLSHEDIKIPEKGKIYSINEGNSKHWHPGTQEYIKKVKEEGKTGRYVGSLVADFHRNLLLLYEANPLAFIAEQAGGKASTGEKRMMEVVPEELHQRTSLIIGSKLDVEEAERCWQEAAVVTA
jgi:fructose-1,6-bisphosphatase I